MEPFQVFALIFALISHNWQCKEMITLARETYSSEAKLPLNTLPTLQIWNFNLVSLHRFPVMGEDETPFFPQ